MGHVDGSPPPEPQTIYVNVTGSVLSERDLVEKIREGLMRPGPVTVLGPPAEITPRPTCSTCMHWDPHPSNTYGTCKRVTDGSDGAWIEAELHEDWAYKAEPATLDTDADFGCTEHTPAARPSPVESPNV